MWKEIWRRHRSKLCAALGGAIFLASGAAVSFLPFLREQEATFPAPAQTTGTRREPAEEASAPVAPAQSDEEDRAQKKPVEEDWYLYITGSVRKPGLYRLPPKSRLTHLVDAAGGFDGFADRTAVNLAEPLSDGQHVHVFRKGERESVARRRENETSVASGHFVIIASPPHPGAQPKNAAKPARNSQTRVDINHADAETLTQLRGIGPTLARRIVEYRRQYGPFRSVEELINVKGIGAAKVNGLRKQAIVTP